MLVALDTRSNTTDGPAERLRRAAADQVGAAVLAVEGRTRSGVDASASMCAELSQIAAQSGVRVCALAASHGPPLGADSSTQRQQARWNVLQLLADARATGAGAIVISPFAEERDASCPDYAAALARVFDELCQLRHHAEAMGVEIVLDAADHRFLASPTEAADFLDDVNSYALGWQLNTSAIRSDQLAAWVRDLARSLRIVSAPTNPHDNDALLSALRLIDYQGAILVRDIETYKQWTARLDPQGAATGKADCG